MAEIKNYTLHFGYGRAARLTYLRQVSLHRNLMCGQQRCVGMESS